MYVPIPIIALIAGAFVLLAMLALRRTRPTMRDADEMITCQRRECDAAPTRPRTPDAARSHLAPDTLPSDEEALLAIPEVRGAIEKGRKAAAIRHLRDNAGLDTRESRRLVERHARRR